jgi:hypothetical protein
MVNIRTPNLLNVMFCSFFFSFPCLKPTVDPTQAPCFAFGNFSGKSIRSATISAGIFKQSVGAKNRVRIGLSYRPASAGIFKQSIGAKTE